MPATNIDEVLSRLDEIIAQSIVQKDPHGVFAALYRRVTEAVKQGIGDGVYDDGPRMERLDVIFANRYISAWEARQQQQKATEAWNMTFEAAGEGRRRLMLQHLMLGMNAHINLDLGIAAASVSKGADIASLQADFNRISDLLLQMIDEVQDSIRAVSPLFGIIDWFFKDRDERFAGFSLRTTRTLAWTTANTLMTIPESEQSNMILLLDRQVAGIGKHIAAPRGFFNWLIRMICYFENQDIAKQIAAVNSR